MIASVTEITATEIASAKFNLMADGEGDPRGRIDASHLVNEDGSTCNLVNPRIYNAKN